MASRPKKGRATVVAQPQQPLPTVIEFLLDETGSMDSVKAPTIGGFNDFLREQRSNPGLALLTLTKFDTTGLKTPFVDIDVKVAPELTWNTFNPGSSTNLHDAIVERSVALAERLSSWQTKPHVLFIVMTDGMDNASRRTADHVRENVIYNMERGWTYAYLGADQNALMIAQRLGFPEGNVKSFASAEMQKTFHDVSKATTAYRSARAMATDTFTSTDYFSARG